MTTNERVEVLPVSEAACPACKSKTVKIVTISPDVGHGAVWPESFAVKCLACDMRGPRHIAQADALAAWNRLSSQSLPGEVSLREAVETWLADYDDDRRDLQLEFDHAARFRALLASPQPSRDEMRSLLERCRDREYNPFEPDNQTKLWHDLDAALKANSGAPK